VVLAWLNWLPNAVVRRLQLAAEAGRTLGVLFREHEARHSPAALRLCLQPARAGLRVQLLKARGTCRYRSIHLPLH
jgi:cell division inhibitor SulA/protein ImuA